MVAAVDQVRGNVDTFGASVVEPASNATTSLPAVPERVNVVASAASDAAGQLSIGNENYHPLHLELCPMTLLYR